MVRCGGGPAADGGGIVLNWLFRLALVLGVTGLLGFDGISIGSSRLIAADDAVTAAAAASREWHSSGQVDLAYDAAVAAVRQTDSGAELPRAAFRITERGDVDVRVVRHATTVLVRWVPGTQRWTLSAADAHSDPPVMP